VSIEVGQAGRGNYLPRLADEPLGELVSHAPAVVLVGPRAAGKTTTARRLAAEVVQLDRAAESAAFVVDPDSALIGRAEPLLLDEWQAVPEVLGAVKRAVDSDPRAGRFILTGSVRADLHGQLWPGTGRLVRLPMTVLTERERRRRDPGCPPFFDRLIAGTIGLRSGAPSLSVLDYAALAVRGSFPEISGNMTKRVRGAWLRSYVDQLVTRDASELIRGTDPAKLRAYFDVLALNTAGLPTDATLYQAAGLNARTAARYDQLLADIGVAVRVPAWSTNRLARVGRRAKRYVIDGGLVAAAAGFNIEALLSDGDLLGRMLDTLVFAQLEPEAALAEDPFRLYHLRTQHGRHEVDLIAEMSTGRVAAVEVKAAAAVGQQDARHLVWLRDELGPRFAAGVVLHTGPDTFRLSDRIWAAPISTLWD